MEFRLCPLSLTCSAVVWTPTRGKLGRCQAHCLLGLLLTPDPRLPDTSWLTIFILAFWVLYLAASSTSSLAVKWQRCKDTLEGTFFVCCFCVSTWSLHCTAMSTADIIPVLPVLELGLSLPKAKKSMKAHSSLPVGVLPQCSSSTVPHCPWCPQCSFSTVLHCPRVSHTKQTL